MKTARNTKLKGGMSAEARKRQAERMKAYWAKRRAKKAGAKQAAAKPKRKRGMSAEARKRQGERMKEYWAKRRQQKAGTAEGPQAEAATANGSGKSTGKASQKRRNK